MRKNSVVLTELEAARKELAQRVSANWCAIRAAVGLTVGEVAYLSTYGITSVTALVAKVMHGVIELVRRGVVVAAKLIFLPLVALACLVFPDKDTPVRRIVEGVKAWWREFA
jgi:hypothetical protein